ncbi:uncharacterized protein GLRG_02501 [Colletotrichum graminicola M1.001]|uniref:Uncharacterized protein n=1 Tax=Colletotrichum graminicola (strain M1.001 / M2 / FGSC 10212) TaxID=645133 RepID=E3Q743_COLGM|nr:uncharacterized protein GLRG_02501 [Colletotrichum graminicola M1.001]EFQ26681.1 hypothetical protein GLRG_02501 [Colletotrichum graminicola M1.001]
MANDKMYDVLPGRESAVYDGTKGNEAPHVASEKAINMDDEPAFLENSPTNMLITRVIQTSTSCNADPLRMMEEMWWFTVARIEVDPVQQPTDSTVWQGSRLVLTNMKTYIFVSFLTQSPLFL